MLRSVSSIWSPSQEYLEGKIVQLYDVQESCVTGGTVRWFWRKRAVSIRWWKSRGVKPPACASNWKQRDLQLWLCWWWFCNTKSNFVACSKHVLKAPVSCSTTIDRTPSILHANDCGWNRIRNTRWCVHSLTRGIAAAAFCTLVRIHLIIHRYLEFLCALVDGLIAKGMSCKQITPMVFAEPSFHVNSRQSWP